MQIECESCFYVHKSESCSVSKHNAHLSSDLFLSQSAVFVWPRLCVSSCSIISLKVSTLLSAESPPLIYCYFRYHACFLFNIHAKSENISCRRWSVDSCQNLPDMQRSAKNFRSAGQFLDFHWTSRSLLFWRVTKCHCFESTAVFHGDRELEWMHTTI